MIDIDELEAAANGCEYDEDLLGITAIECKEIASQLRLLDAMNKELMAALEGLLSDMRLRAKLDGDVDSDGCVVLNCGNGVLYAANNAIAKAKATS